MTSLSIDVDDSLKDFQEKVASWFPQIMNLDLMSSSWNINDWNFILMLLSIVCFLVEEYFQFLNFYRGWS